MGVVLRGSYDAEEWASTYPDFTRGEEARLLRGTDATRNLCIGGLAAPELMVLGPPKTGTTSLCAALRYSPSAVFPRSLSDAVGDARFPAKWKEGHFFDGRAQDRRAMFDYGRCDTSVRRITVEGSARYANDPAVPGAIRGAFGRAASRISFVYLFRDPLPRLLSQVNHGKEFGWCSSYRHLSFEAVCRRIVQGDAGDWLGSGSGCGDTVEGSLYAHHIRRYFGHFNPRQFWFIPFRFLTEPGEGGRPAKPVAQTLWELLGARGLPPPDIHTNRRSRTTPEKLLTPATLVSINAWFDERTGPKVLAKLLVNNEAKLWGFQGVRATDDLAQWIKGNW